MPSSLLERGGRSLPILVLTNIHGRRWLRFRPNRRTICRTAAGLRQKLHIVQIAILLIQHRILKEKTAIIFYLIIYGPGILNLAFFRRWQSPRHLHFGKLVITILLILTTRLQLFAFRDGLIFHFTEHEITRSLIWVVLANFARILII